MRDKRDRLGIRRIYCIKIWLLVVTMHRVHTAPPVLSEGWPLWLTLAGATLPPSGSSGDGHSVETACVVITTWNYQDQS